MKRAARSACAGAVFVLAGLAAVLAAVSAGERTEAGGLEWMAGYWTGEQGGMRMEEVWLAPRGGLMLGMHRDAADPGKTSFEFLRIEMGPEGIVYLASPLGRPATPFPLASRSQQKVIFENRQHDFPRRIIYWREGDDLLHARVEGEKNGVPRNEEWVWRRAPLAQSGAVSAGVTRE